MSKSLSITVVLSCIAFLFGGVAHASTLTPKEISLNSQTEKKVQRKSPVVKASFSPFTGKVMGEKVRMRLQPDLEGYIVRDLAKNELVAVIDQEGDYFCVSPPDAIKAYVFRSFVLDNVVEGNRVNVRLEPDLEAPIIAHLNSGDHVEGIISSSNKKWLEIAPPNNTRFYVSKEYIESIGGPELKEKMAKRQETVEQLLEGATLLAQSEMNNPFEEVNFDQIKQGFLTVIHDYTDFPRMSELAKEALVKVQEEYLQKRISYLEQKAALVSNFSSVEQSSDSNKRASSRFLNQVVQMWEPVEEALYINWAKLNESRGKEAFYAEQKLVATSISGVLESYRSPIKNRPGDYIVKNKNLPVAYVYSTVVNLDDYLGKKITLVTSPRSNNNFAFPAFFVHDVE